jgi:hypothetical protein
MSSAGGPRETQRLEGDADQPDMSLALHLAYQVEYRVSHLHLLTCCRPDPDPDPDPEPLVGPHEMDRGPGPTGDGRIAFCDDTELSILCCLWTIDKMAGSFTSWIPKWA